MPLKEEMQQQGQWLFRWRSYLPLALLPLVVWAILDVGGRNHPPVFWTPTCMTISFLGLVFRCWVVGFVPGCTSGRNIDKQEAGKLNQTGIYSIVRHPLYLGNFFMVLGLVLFIRSAWFLPVFVLAYWMYYERIMLAEEAFLAKQYGKEFQRWASRTPAVIPSLRRFVPPVMAVSFKTVLRREYPGFFGLVSSFTILQGLRTYLVDGRFYLSGHWWLFLLMGALIYITLRSLKRYTRLLTVDGR